MSQNKSNTLSDDTQLYGTAHPGTTTQDVVADDDEYYTRNLSRTIGDNLDADEEVIAIPGQLSTDGEDDFSHSGSSLYEGSIVSMSHPYSPHSSNQGGDINEDIIVDQDSTSAEVGAPGHWGVDEDTG